VGNVEREKVAYRNGHLVRECVRVCVCVSICDCV
jgi:hypothetical protein